PGSLILVYLAQLPLYGVGLSLGVKAAMIAGATATLGTLATGVASGMLFTAIEVLPALALIHRALRPAPEGDGWAPAGALAMALVMLGLVALGVAGVALAGSEGGFRGAVFGFLAEELAGIFSSAGLSASDSAARATDTAGLVAPLFPAMAIGSWLLMTT